MAPIQRSLINVDLLTKDEVKWVDKYHETVKDFLLPILQKSNDFESLNSPNAIEYLLRETAPLSS